MYGTQWYVTQWLWVEHNRINKWSGGFIRISLSNFCIRATYSAKTLYQLFNSGGEWSTNLSKRYIHVHKLHHIFFLTYHFIHVLQLHPRFTTPSTFYNFIRVLQLHPHLSVHVLQIPVRKALVSHSLSMRKTDRLIEIIRVWELCEKSPFLVLKRREDGRNQGDFGYWTFPHAQLDWNCGAELAELLNNHDDSGL